MPTYTAKSAQSTLPSAQNPKSYNGKDRERGAQPECGHKVRPDLVQITPFTPSRQWDLGQDDVSELVFLSEKWGK